MVVIAVTPIAFVLEFGENLCIPHVLWHFTFLQQRQRDDDSFVILQDFGLVPKAIVEVTNTDTTALTEMHISDFASHQNLDITFDC